jgi:hypothetical protein
MRANPRTTWSRPTSPAAETDQQPAPPGHHIRSDEAVRNQPAERSVGASGAKPQRGPHDGGLMRRPRHGGLGMSPLRPMPWPPRRRARSWARSRRGGRRAAPRTSRTPTATAAGRAWRLNR